MLALSRAKLQAQVLLREERAAAERSRADALRRIQGPLVVDSDDEPTCPAVPGPVVGTDCLDTQMFVPDTQVVMDCLFTEEQQLLETPPSQPVARKLFHEDAPKPDLPSVPEPTSSTGASTGAGSPAQPAVVSPATNPTPSPLPAEDKFLEFSPPKVVTRSDQLGLKRTKKEGEEDSAPKRGRPPTKSKKGKAKCAAKPKSEGRVKERASSSKDKPDMVSCGETEVKRSRKCKSAAAKESSEPGQAGATEDDVHPDAGAETGPQKRKGRGKGRGKGKRARIDSDPRPMMMAFPVPEYNDGADAEPTFSAPVMANGRSSLAVHPSTEQIEQAAAPAAKSRKLRKKKKGKRAQAKGPATAPAESAECVPGSEMPEAGECGPGSDVPKDGKAEDDEMPNVFAGRRCPQTPGIKGWLIWQNIVKTFVEVIAPNLPERSRTKHEYEYWKRAKKAFDEDDSVITEKDFKIFFLVQSELYVQEELIPGLQVGNEFYHNDDSD
ncbi:unnamed protein product [Symbiodinium sp. CCMP2592]|nr:unnamed protein product [Symbiodinium sp. CCMP2592]